MRKAGIVLAAVAVVAGCGGGSGTLSKAEYQKKMKAEGAKLDQAVKGLDFARQSDLSVLGTKLDMLQKRFDDVASDIEGLKPPKNVVEDNRKIADALHKFAAGFRRIRDAARAKDRARITTLLGGLQGANVEGASASNDLKAKGYDVGTFGN
jgi:hypothetical protein